MSYLLCEGVWVLSPSQMAAQRQLFRFAQTAGHFRAITTEAGFASPELTPCLTESNHLVLIPA
jgi:hypothetical protein